MRRGQPEVPPAQGHTVHSLDHLRRGAQCANLHQLPLWRVPLRAHPQLRAAGRAPAGHPDQHSEGQHPAGVRAGDAVPEPTGLLPAIPRRVVQ